jgi:hypothetical protein
MLHPQLIAIQQRRAVMNAGVAVAIDAVVVVGNAPSVVRALQKRMQQ